MSGLLFPTGFCPDIGSYTVHPASAQCPEPRLFGSRDDGLWEWPDSSCHSLVGSFEIEFFSSYCLKSSFKECGYCHCHIATIDRRTVCLLSKRLQCKSRDLDHGLPLSVHIELVHIELLWIELFIILVKLLRWHWSYFILLQCLGSVFGHTRLFDKNSDQTVMRQWWNSDAFDLSSSISFARF
jgi:hypothetical protein